eukprot:TRINITY_DN7966_c0_g1_i1.p1 TRINITY_DN7966_c0_g1~~TRINITY_DN7966_c0_g1_i1.p1  ORF type:complete len:122 (-),score=27.66 TRINITY_DN7966_c0_g1_i1:105-470(-)
MMLSFMFFFFNDTATTEIYTRSIVGSVRCVQETDMISQILITQKTNMMDLILLHELNTYKCDAMLKINMIQRLSSFMGWYQIELCLLLMPVSYTHLRAHETSLHLVCRLLLEKKKKQQQHL